MLQKADQKSIPAQNTLQAAAADMGIDAKDVHEGQMLREAKKAKPGLFLAQEIYDRSTSNGATYGRTDTSDSSELWADHLS